MLTTRRDCVAGVLVSRKRIRRRHWAEPVRDRLGQPDQRVVRERDVGTSEAAAGVLETVAAPEPELQRGPGRGRPLLAAIDQHAPPAGGVASAPAEPEHREQHQPQHQGPVRGRGRRVQVAVRQLGQPGRAEQRRWRLGVPRRRGPSAPGRPEEEGVHEGPAGPRARAVQDAQPPGPVLARAAAAEDGPRLEQRPLVRRRADQPERNAARQQGRLHRDGAHHVQVGRPVPAQRDQHGAELHQEDGAEGRPRGDHRVDRDEDGDQEPVQRRRGRIRRQQDQRQRWRGDRGEERTKLIDTACIGMTR